MRPLLTGLLLAELAALASPGAAAELWRWIDADGVARYTPEPDRVPASRRSTLARVEAGMPPAPQPEPAQARPPAIFAPPGDPTLAEDPWNAPEPARAVEGRIIRDPGEIVVELPTAEPPAPPAPAPEAAPLSSEPQAAARPELASPEPAPQRPPRSELASPVVAPPDLAPPDAAPPEPATPAVAAVSAPAGASAPAAPRPLSPDREARRAELADAIARDEEALKAHVSSGGSASIVASPELREIAERLPALQAELRALEAQSAAP